MADLCNRLSISRTPTVVPGTELLNDASNNMSCFFDRDCNSNAR